MLQVRNLGKSYGTRVLFSGVSFNMVRGEKIGLVGRNGQGKTTLFRIIQQEENASEGEIVFPKNYRLGYLKQHLAFTRPTLLEEGALGLPEGERDDSRNTYKVEKILAGLGFSEGDMGRSPQEFSGGLQIRIHLAKVLLSEPDLLLLDEPTNYLDIVTMRWLERFLVNWRNEFILITHDRHFMDKVSTHTMGIHRGKVRKIPGDSMKYYTQLASEEETMEKTRLNEEKKVKEIQSFVDRFRATASKATQVQSRIKAIERMDTSEKLSELANLDFRFTYEHSPGQVLLKMEKGSFAYPGPEPFYLFQDLTFQVKKKDRIGVIGKNGKGKTTLLKALAGEETLLSGEISTHPLTKIAYFGQTNINRLDSKKTIDEEIAGAAPDLATARVRGVCGTMLFSGDDARKKISVLSGGERSRVLLGKILVSPSNLLLLDEPTNHLDMESVESLIDAFDGFPGAILLVTHNELILERMATKLIIFRNNQELLFFDGTYNEFLEKWGWEEEKEEKGASRGQAKGQKSPKSNKEIKAQRSEINLQKGRSVNPLKEEQARIEKSIIALEARVTLWQREIISLSEKGAGQEIPSLSKSLKSSQNEIEEFYSRLEEISIQIDSLEKEFQFKLEGLEREE